MIVDVPQTPQRKTSAGLLAPETVAPVRNDFRAIRVDHGPEINALRAPDIPEGFGAGFFAGAQRLAQGVQALGGFMSGVALKVGEARAAQQVNDAEVLMSKAHGDFVANYMLKHPNEPDAWGAEWEKHATELRQQLLSNDSLLPVARDAIDASWKRFAVIKGGEIQGAMVRQQFTNTKNSYIANAATMREQGNYVGSDAALDEGYHGGYLHKMEHFTLKKANRDAQEGEAIDTAKSLIESANPFNGGYQKARDFVKANEAVVGKNKQKLYDSIDGKERSDGVLNAINENPVLELKRLESYSENGKPTNYADWMTPGERAQYTAHARGAVALQSRKEATAFLTAMTGNAIKNAEHAESFFQSGATDDAEKARYMQIWREGRGDTKEVFIDAQRRVHGFDVSNRDGLRDYREIVLRKWLDRELPKATAEAMQNQLNSVLKEQKPENTAKAFISKSALDLHNSKSLGIDYSGQKQALATIKDPKVLQALGISPEAREHWYSREKTPIPLRNVDGPKAFTMFKELAKTAKLDIDLYNKLDPKQKAIVDDVLHGTSLNTQSDLEIESLARAEQIVTEWNQHVFLHPEKAGMEDAMKFIEEAQTRFGADAINNVIEGDKKKKTGAALPKIHVTPPDEKTGPPVGSGVNDLQLPSNPLDFNETLDQWNPVRVPAKTN